MLLGFIASLICCSSLICLLILLFFVGNIYNRWESKRMNQPRWDFCPNCRQQRIVKKSEYGQINVYHSTGEKETRYDEIVYSCSYCDEELGGVLGITETELNRILMDAPPETFRWD